MYATTASPNTFQYNWKVNLWQDLFTNIKHRLMVSNLFLLDVFPHLEQMKTFKINISHQINKKIF